MVIIGPKHVPDEEPAELPSKSQKFTMRCINFTQNFSSTNKDVQAGFGSSDHKKKGKKNVDCRPYDEEEQFNSRHFNLRQIKYATHNFSSTNKVGQAGFGPSDHKKKGKRNGDCRPCEEKEQFNSRYFSLKQIKDATQNFSSANKIGQGGFGSIYKGVLPDKTAIAVKKLSNNSSQGSPEFQNEVYFLSTLKHPNLVKLLGCCTEKKQRILVYEYITNGSLDRAIFGSDFNLKGRCDWASRVKICLGIAKGLAFLHDDKSKAKIVHRDIKLSNILLDEYLNPKISDFGLAKQFYNEDQTHFSTVVVGTLGYLDPDYFRSQMLTEKADVYGFGIVTLELMSGRRCIELQPRTKENYEILKDLAISLLKKGALIELIDADLITSFSVKEATMVLNLAMLCIVDSPTLRPTMSEVVSILEGKTMMKTLPPPLEPYYSQNLRFKSERTTTDISIHQLSSTSGVAVLSSHVASKEEEDNTLTAFHGDLVSDLNESRGEGEEEASVLIQANIATTLEPPKWTARFSTSSVFVDATNMEDKGEFGYVKPSFEGGKHQIKCSDEEFEAGCNEWKDSLVGYFLDEKEPFNVDQETIEKLWEVKGNVSMFSMGNGYFLFQFNCVEDKIRVLESSDLWHIEKRPWVLKQWDWRLKFDKTEMKSLPVWVKIYNLPLFLWTSSFLSKVGSGLGIPLYVDQKTKNRDRLDYAKLCIETDASKPLPETWHISVKGVDYQLNLEYDWRPMRCANCCTFGHIESKCKLKMNKTKQE